MCSKATIHRYTMLVIKCNNKNVRDSIIITIGFSISPIYSCTFCYGVAVASAAGVIVRRIDIYVCMYGSILFFDLPNSNWEIQKITKV